MEGSSDVEIGKSLEPNVNPQNPQPEFNNPEVLEQERKPGSPEINIRIFYSPHETERDIDGFEEEFRKADIFIPERFGWTEETLRVFRKLSEGKLSPEDTKSVGGKFAEIENELDRVIYNSRKLIAFIDLPEGHPLEAEIEDLELPRLKFGPDSLNQNMARAKNYFQKSADLEKKREGFMSTQIKPKIDELLDEYPSLRDKKELRVVMMLGSVHTSFFDLLSDQNLKVTKTLSKSSLVFASPFHLELGKSMHQGEPARDELTARTVFEMGIIIACRRGLKKLSRDTHKIDAFIVRLNSQFDLGEIKGMFEGVSNADEFRKLFEEKLKQKGLMIPKSEQELDAFLAKPLPPRPNSQPPKQQLQ